jgi:hypothetical protein
MYGLAIAETLSLGSRHRASAAGISAMGQCGGGLRLGEPLYGRTVTSTASTGRTEPWFAAAFPTRLREDVHTVVELLPPARLGPSSTFSAVVDGGPVTIPYRIYNDEPPAEIQNTLSLRLATV